MPGLAAGRGRSRAAPVAHLIRRGGIESQDAEPSREDAAALTLTQLGKTLGLQTLAESVELQGRAK
jgi:hypothetical protein